MKENEYDTGYTEEQTVGSNPPDSLELGFRDFEELLRVTEPRLC